MSKSVKISRREHIEVQRKSKRNRTLMTWGGILAFIGILSYTTWTQVGGGNSLPPDEVADPWLGAEEAKVEIIEFGDFGCHACQAWHNLGIREQVLAQYGDQVRFTWRDFPVITNQSPKAAEAGHCAGAQGKFWEFHDHVYENQVGLGRSQLESYAEAVGLDLAAFGQCLDEKNMTLKVQENEQIARRFGIRGTPGFVLNGQVLASPPTYPFLSSLIERELAAE